MLLVVLALTTSAFGQLSGDIQGTLLDQSGAVIPDAKITVRNLLNNAVRSTTSNSLGQFAVQQLDIGKYEVKVEKNGFKTTVVEAEVRSGERTPIRIDMGVGATGETVTVEAVTPLLDVNTSQVSTSFDAQITTSLPSQFRNPVALANLSPGVVPVTKDNPFLGVGSFNSNGSRGRGNNITVDGVTTTDISTTGTAGIGTISQDAIAEVKLITNNFSAEFGRNSGAQVQIITKGGTNEYHGSVYWYHQNAALNARDYFDTTGKATPLRRNQWGFAAGGPVIKDKVFLFGHYEGLKIRGAGSSRTATVLTPAQATAITNPTSQALFTAVGAPTSASGQLASGAPNSTDTAAWSLRYDQVMRGGNDVVNVRYGQNPLTSVSPGLTFIHTNLTNFGAGSVSLARNTNVGWTHTFSPAVVNTFRFAFGRSNPNFAPFTTTTTPTPQINISGFASLGVWSGLPQGRVQNTFQWSDTVAWTTGRHAIKIGGDVYYYQANSFFDSNFRGTVTFASLADFQNGVVNSWTQNFGTSRRYNRAKDLMFFVQDDLRVTNTFTLNLGLRVERSGGVTEKFDVLSNLNRNRFDPIGSLGTGAMGTPELGGQAFRSNLNWAPRFGFAWNPNNGKLVIRSGYGWAYDYIFLNPITNLRFAAPFVPSISLVTAAVSGANSYANLVAGTASAQTSAQASVGFFPATRANFGALSTVQQDLRQPRNQQWNLGVQYEIMQNLVAKASYVGTRNSRLQVSVPINLISPAVRPAPATSEADEIARRPAFAAVNTASSGGATTGSNRLDPRFNGVTQVSSVGDSNYHAMQLELTKRMAKGLSFSVNYTWGHSIDTASDVLGVLVNDSPLFQDPRDLAGNKGNSQFDVRHRFVGNFVWQLPFSTTGAARRLTNGWTVSGIVARNSGLPTSIFAGVRRGVGDIALLGGGIVRANGDVTQITPGAGAPALCARGVVTAANSTSCPNTSGFPLTQPLLGNLGNSQRNVLRLDSLFNTDLAVMKETPITERVRVQFRWEVFNLFNTANMSGYQGTLTSTTFNTYQSTATDSRQMQLALKFVF